ncbi:calpain-3-like [Hydra vulgaris]|uniref:Calpain-3-like n=1 Tax=Hydra vulgaris TaxID=6087 RepID=A0ABM4CDX5_HYDVU
MKKNKEVIEEEITYVTVNQSQNPDINLCIDTKENVLLSSSSSNETKIQKAAAESATSETKDTKFRESFGKFFYKVAGTDELIDSFELQNVLKMIFNSSGTSISMETSRSMLAFADSNRDGRLSFNEFKSLWFSVMKWKKCFEKSDLDKDKMINKMEMKNALEDIGFHQIRPLTIDAVFARNGNKNNLLGMDDFIQVLCKLTSVARWSKEFDKKMTLDSFLKELLYC